MSDDNYPPMERECDNCKGTKVVERIIDNGKKKKKIKDTCPRCHGRGKVLTNFGDALLELMANYQPWQRDLQTTEDGLRDAIRDARYGGMYGDHYY